ncbi:hypothetical protein BTVI_104327 [Pitangus sulphuratus]|nr:hypothetical protein BTVI_104327 [Pitangus sulphuratus]
MTILTMTLLESSMTEKDLALLVNIKFNIRQQRALAAKKATDILDCIRSNVACRSRGLILSLYSTGETTFGVLGPVMGSSIQERHGHPGESPVKSTKMMKGLEHIKYKERLRELGQFSAEKRRFGVES